MDPVRVFANPTPPRHTYFFQGLYECFPWVCKYLCMYVRARVMLCAKLNYSLVKFEISVRSLVVAIVMVFHSFWSAVDVVFVYLGV